MNNVMRCLSLLLLIVSVLVSAQETATTESVTQDATPEEKNTEAQPVAEKPKKLVDSATINLRTTVTGNQEQPRVLYIMPWQSPTAPELEIEMLSSQQDAVFGHVEREEMLRGLEAAGELDKAE
jgi:hypothetical protein